MIRKSQINQIGVLVLTMGIVLISCTGCQSEKKNVNVPKLVEPVGVDIDTATVKKMDFGSMNSYQGEIVPDIKGMYFVNAGQVASVKVEIGDKVKKGQLLATLKGADTTVKDLQKELRDLLEENTELNETAKNKIQQLRIGTEHMISPVHYILIIPWKIPRQTRNTVDNLRYYQHK